jgi:hypothetical protein
VKRYHQDLERIKRAHRTHLREVHNWPKKAIDCQCELQAGRFRKKKALGCGRSRCLVCHYDKLTGIKSANDWIREQQFEDSMEDYLDSIAEIREEVVAADAV